MISRVRREETSQETGGWRMFSWRATSATAALVLTMAGCGRADTSGAAASVQQVYAAADAVRQTAGLRFTFSTTNNFSGRAIKATGEGAVDFRRDRALFSLTAPVTKTRTFTVTQVITRDRVLYKVPAERRSMSGGRPWVSRPVTSEERARADRNDQTQLNVLSTLRQAGATVRRRGSERVRGVRATRFRFDKRKTTSSDGRGGTSSNGAFHGDVWLTRGGLPVRLVQSSGRAHEVSRSQADYFDVGKQPNIPDPPASDVFEVADDNKALEIVQPPS
jgi:hypothetical protein